jgi:hypothetical protein
MAKWEYHVESLACDLMSERLIGLGDEGWELDFIQSHPRRPYPASVSTVFKRPAKPKRGDEPMVAP